VHIFYRLEEYINMTELKQVFQVGDQSFETKAEAMAFMRRPKITEALKTFIADNDKLVSWLVDNQETVETAFEAGVIQRVTKSDIKKLEAALAAVTKAGAKDTQFIIDNSEAIATSFRWPSVKRMTDEEKSAAALEILTTAADGNEKLAGFIIENKEPILAAYKAGVVKREVSPNAVNALEAYRAKQKAEKEAKAAAEAPAGTA